MTIATNDGSAGTSKDPGSSEPQKLTRKQRNAASTKKSIDPLKLTPEYIASMRALRETRKLERQKAQGGPAPPAAEESVPVFIQRPLLQVQAGGSGFPCKIMSYNVLAQALIRRKLFPTSGSALKWPLRSHALLLELKYYDADIMCLQEVDHIQYNLFWNSQFDKLGYASKFYRSGTKNHGVAIVYRHSVFHCRHQSFIRYDTEDPQDFDVPAPRTHTQNVGMLALLEFQPSLVARYPHLSNKNGIIVGTTHLFWHPFGTFERTRQTFVAMHKMREFSRILTTVLNNDKGFYSFFAGDMNSQPFDSPYLLITAKPVEYTESAKNVLSRALCHEYTRSEPKENKGETGEESIECQPSDEQSEVQQDEGDAGQDHGEKVGRDIIQDQDEQDNEKDDDGVIKGQREEDITEQEQGPPNDCLSDDPRIPPPSTCVEHEQLIEQVKRSHNLLDVRAISLYSVGYGRVHSENSGIDNARNEPQFSNWAHTWRGLLDYIFVVVKWDKEKDNYTNKVDTAAELESQHGVRLISLLRLPLPSEMGPEPSGQPRLGQYPSDHLCIMATIELV